MIGNEVISELMQLIDIAIKKDITTKTDIFFEYSSHTKQIDIRIYLNGWKNEILWDEDYRIYLDEPNAINKINVLRVRIESF